MILSIVFSCFLSPRLALVYICHVFLFLDITLFVMVHGFIDSLSLSRYVCVLSEWPRLISGLVSLMSRSTPAVINEDVLLFGCLEDIVCALILSLSDDCGGSLRGLCFLSRSSSCFFEVSRGSSFLR